MSSKEQHDKGLNRRGFFKASCLAASSLVLPGIFIGDEINKRREINLEGLEPLEVIRVEEREGTVRLADTPVVIFPLRDDFFSNRGKPIEQWRLSGADLSFSKIYTLRTPEGRGIRVAPLWHTTGAKVLPVAMLDEGYFARQTRQYVAQTRHVEEIRNPDIADFTIVGNYYPNKQHNLLEAAAQFLRYQIAHREFFPGITYSTIEILGIAQDRQYRTGMINNVEVRAAGVCGLATALAHSLSQTDTRFDEHETHSYWTYYWVGPLDPAIRLENDTQVGSSPEGTHDFRWTPDRRFYVSIDSSMAVEGFRAEDPFTGNDSLLLLSLKLTETRPELEEQLGKIVEIQAAYDDFNRRGTSPAPVIQEGQLEHSYDWEQNPYFESLYRAVRIEEDRSGFEDELTGDPLTKDILAGQTMVESYMREYSYEDFRNGQGRGLGDYIRESDWFRSLDRERQDSTGYGLRQLNGQTWRYQNQVTQCIAWAVFLYSLDRANSPLDISGFDIDCARDVIPRELRGSGGPQEIHTWSGAPCYISTERLEDFEPGDLFVTQSMNFESTLGHVGVIIAKKTINGKISLLISDANRGFDGRVRMFKADDTNKYAIFGKPPVNWVGIRRPNV